MPTGVWGGLLVPIGIWGCLCVIQVPNGIWNGLLVSECAYCCLIVHTGVWGCLLVSKDAYWCLSVPTAVWWCILVSECAYCCLMVHTGVWGCILVSMDAYWCLRLPMGVCTISEPQWPSPIPNLLVLYSTSCVTLIWRVVVFLPYLSWQLYMFVLPLSIIMYPLIVITFILNSQWFFEWELNVCYMSVHTCARRQSRD